MGKRKFYIEFSGTAKIELDDAVIDVVDDQWRRDLYNLNTPEEIAGMIGRCMVLNGWSLHSMDGWTDQPDSNARIIYEPDWEIEAVEAREIK
jgi:hypothetical protein